MPGKRIATPALTLAACLAGTGLANAATANFQGNCTTTQISGNSYQTSCLFSPNKAPVNQSYTSCDGSGVSSYGWDFGDGSTASTVPSVDFGRASHIYYHQGNNIEVQSIVLTVYCGNGATPTATHCLSTLTAGCINPGTGWTP